MPLFSQPAIHLHQPVTRQPHKKALDRISWFCAAHFKHKGRCKSAQSHSNLVLLVHDPLLPDQVEALQTLAESLFPPHHHHNPDNSLFQSLKVPPILLSCLCFGQHTRCTGNISHSLHWGRCEWSQAAQLVHYKGLQIPNCIGVNIFMYV